jgi:hypothetical protein
MSPRTERLAILPFQSLEAGARADDFGIGLAERVEARLQEQVAESRTLRFSPLRDAVDNGVTNAVLAGSKLAADLVVEGSLSGALNRRRLVVSLQARAPNGAFIERRSGEFSQKSEETLVQFEVRLARQLAEWLGASGSKGPSPGGTAASAGSQDSSRPADPEVAEDIRADLRLAAAQAHFLRGDFADSAQLIKEYRLDQTADGYLLNCQLLWESGDRSGALAELDAALAVFARQRVAREVEGGERRRHGGGVTPGSRTWCGSAPVLRCFRGCRPARCGPGPF